MFKKFSKKIENNTLNNDSKIIEFIQPIFEIIIKNIIESRIKDVNDKNNLIINYKTNNNKLIDLSQIEIKTDSENSRIYEINIYVFFKRNDILFIVEHWKFKIDTSNCKGNELDNKIKNRIKKKLITFYRSIKSLEIILPLNSLVKKSFDYSFQVKLYHQSNIVINPQEKIKQEKKHIRLETKDDNNFSIQLDIYFYTIDGITKNEQIFKEIIDYNKIYTEVYSKISLNKTGKSKLVPNIVDNNNNNNNNDINKNNTNNNNENDNNNDDKNNSFGKFEESESQSDQDDLLMSSIIFPKIVEKKGDINQSDLDDIKRGINNKKVDLDELYKCCFNKYDDINCRKNIDELFDINNVMKNEKEILNEVRDKYNLHFDNNNKLLMEELYEENKNIDFNDLMIYNSKSNKNIKENNKNGNKEKENENEKNLYQNIISDFFEIKQLLNQ